MMKTRERKKCEEDKESLLLPKYDLLPADKSKFDYSRMTIQCQRVFKYKQNLPLSFDDFF